MYTYQSNGMYIFLSKYLLMGRAYVPACPPYIHYPHGMINSNIVWKASYRVALYMKQLMHTKNYRYKKISILKRLSIVEEKEN